jgi:hypothetical protein
MRPIESCHYCDRATYWKVRSTDGSVISVCDWHATSRLPIGTRKRTFDRKGDTDPSETLQVMLPPQPDCGGLMAGKDHKAKITAARSRRSRVRYDPSVQSNICWGCGSPYDLTGRCTDCFEYEKEES